MPDNIPQAPLPDLAPAPLPTPYNGNRATPDDFGAAAGDAPERIGQLSDAIATKARDNANLSAVLSARGQADILLNKTILDDQTGFRSLHGHDALAAGDKAVGDFDTGLNKIGQDLNNPEQQRAFGRYALDLKQEAFRHVQSHIAQETQTVNADAYKTALTGLLQKGGALPVAIDPAQRQSILDNTERTATTRAYQVLGRGASPEEIANFTVPAKAKAVDQFLETLLANESAPGALAQAKAIMLNPETQQLLGGARTAIIEGRINRRADHQEGTAWARAAAQASLYPGTSIIGEDADDRLRTLADQPDSRPEMLKVAEDELQRLKTRGRQAQKDRNDNAYAQGVRAVHDGNNDAFQRAIDALSIPNAGTDAGDKLKSLLDFQRSSARNDLNSPEAQRAYSIAFNDANAALASTRASDTTLSDFLANTKANDGRPLAVALSPSGLKQIGDRFTEKQKKEAADKPLDTGAVKQVKDTLQEALDFPTSPQVALTPEQVAQRNHILDHVRDQRNAWKEANPTKEPRTEDYQEWINEELAKVPGTAAHPWNPLSSNRRVVEIELEQAAAAATAPANSPAIAPTAPAAAPATPAAAPTAPNDQDKAALNWLQKNPQNPAAAKVRAKLKAKGLVQ